jgi:hypothetical protein
MLRGRVVIRAVLPEKLTGLLIHSDLGVVLGSTLVAEPPRSLGSGEIVSSFLKVRPFKSLWLEPAPTTRAHPRDPFAVWVTDTGEAWEGWRETERDPAVRQKTWPKAHWREIPSPPGFENQPKPWEKSEKTIEIRTCKTDGCRFEPMPFQDPNHCSRHQPIEKPMCIHDVFLHLPVCDECYALHGKTQVRTPAKPKKKSRKG